MTPNTYALLAFIGGILFGFMSKWGLLSFEKKWRKHEERRADGLELRLKQLADKLKEKA